MNWLDRLRHLGRQRIERNRLRAQLGGLQRQKAMLESDLEKMRHWSPDAQQRMQDQIDAVTKRIVFIERSLEEY